MVKTKCKRCGWSWFPRVDDPTSCPKCKRYDWNVDVKDMHKNADKNITKILTKSEDKKHDK